MSEDTNQMAEAVRLLRESGHHEAASDLALKALENANAKQPADEPSQSPPTPAISTEEDQLRAEGEYILDRLTKSLNRHPDVRVPLLDEESS